MPTTGANGGPSEDPTESLSDQSDRWPEIIETARLRLRPPAAGDADDLVRYAGDRDVAEMTAQIPHPYEAEHARTWLAVVQERDWVRAICRRDTGVFAGVVSITPAGPAAPWELGFWLAKPFWGQGLMTEAARGLVAAYFDVTGAPRLQSSAFVGNAASLRIQDKLGFRRRGTVNVYSPVRDQSRDLIVTELERSEFRP